LFVLSPLTNGLGHWSGTQNFNNTAYNGGLLAWVKAGESPHNNHHGPPRSPKFSMQRVEVDPSWLLIALVNAILKSTRFPSAGVGWPVAR
jgi:fatty-acid desaturase